VGPPTNCQFYLQHFAEPLAGFKGPTSKGKDEKSRGEGRRGEGSKGERRGKRRKAPAPYGSRRMINPALNVETAN